MGPCVRRDDDRGNDPPFAGAPSHAATIRDSRSTAISAGLPSKLRYTAYNQTLQASVEGIRAAHPSQKGPVPVDLVTMSASGLDPHISPAAASYQIDRVAAARAMSTDTVRDFVTKATEPRQLGFLGEARVNVLELNLALDALSGATKEPAQ